MFCAGRLDIGVCPLEKLFESDSKIQKKSEVIRHRRTIHRRENLQPSRQRFARLQSSASAAAACSPSCSCAPFECERSKQIDEKMFENRSDRSHDRLRYEEEKVAPPVGENVQN